MVDRLGRNAIWILIFQILVIAVAGCLGCGARNSQKTLSLFAGSKPKYVISPRWPTSSSAGSVRDVSIFHYDPSGKVAIFNPDRMQVDEFRGDGEYVGTLAGGTEAGTPLQTFTSMTAGVDGSLYLLTNTEIIRIDGKNGATSVSDIRHLSDDPVSGLVVSSDGMFYLSRRDKRGIWNVVKYDPVAGTQAVVREDKGRELPPGGRSGFLNAWKPAVAGDNNGDLLIADLSDYRISVYDRSGVLSREVVQRFSPVRIRVQDLFLERAGYRVPFQELYAIPEEQRYFPPIVAIRVTRSGRKIIFTSEADEQMRFRVDVYSPSWDLLGSGYGYNSLRLVPYQFEDGVVAVADLGFMEATPAHVNSHLEAPSIPQRILVFESPL